MGEAAAAPGAVRITAARAPAVRTRLHPIGRRYATTGVREGSQAVVPGAYRTANMKPTSFAGSSVLSATTSRPVPPACVTAMVLMRLVSTTNSVATEHPPPSTRTDASDSGGDVPTVATVAMAKSVAGVEPGTFTQYWPSP